MYSVLFQTVSEIELFHCTVHCTLYRRATRHVLTQVAKLTGEFSKMCYRKQTTHPKHYYATASIVFEDTLVNN
jgi:hypothetical protein